MARIRTIKPEFWTDDLIGSMALGQRLLFIASWNLADDEGLLRWSAPFIKGAVFPFDDDIGVKAVEAMMTALTATGVVFAYTGGRSQQALGYVVNFHKHQRINRPSPSRLPPPPLGDPAVKAMYAARDGNRCHLCGGLIDEAHSQKYGSDFLASPDHLKPISSGGTDAPSNIRIAHVTCNKGRGNRSADEYMELVRSGKTVAQHRFPERFTHIFSEAITEPSVTEQEQEREPGRDTAATSRDPLPSGMGEAERRVLAACGDSPNLVNLSRVRTWLTTGADLELDVLPAIALCRSKKPPGWAPNNLSYFDGPVADALAQRTKPMPEMTDEQRFALPDFLNRNRKQAAPGFMSEIQQVVAKAQG